MEEFCPACDVSSREELGKRNENQVWYCIDCFDEMSDFEDLIEEMSNGHKN